ncbi:hypothetical protein Droror1_Dr00013042 [Drosera rotundifolia]
MPPLLVRLIAPSFSRFIIQCAALFTVNKPADLTAFKHLQIDLTKHINLIPLKWWDFANYILMFFNNITFLFELPLICCSYRTESNVASFQELLLYMLRYASLVQHEWEVSPVFNFDS